MDLTKAALLAWVLQPGAAVADPYCRPTAAEMAALPAALAGDWQSTLLQSMMVVDGNPSGMAPSDAQMAAKVAAAAGGIMVSDANRRQDHRLAAISGDSDFALPGETPLGAQEFLGPVLAEAGVTCAAADLPQFQGIVPATAGMATRLRIFALSDRQMVMLVDEAAEPKANGMRALMRFQR